MDPDRIEFLARHTERNVIPWVPYHARRSEGTLQITDDGARVTVVMEVAGLGALVITADARFSVVENEYKWDRSATLSASPL